MRLKECPFVHPRTLKPLELRLSKAGDESGSGDLTCPDGEVFPVVDGIPDLSFPRQLDGDQLESRNYYEGVARTTTMSRI